MKMKRSPSTETVKSSSSRRSSYRSKNHPASSGAMRRHRESHGSILPETPEPADTNPRVAEVIDEYKDLRYQEKFHVSWGQNDFAYPTKTVFVRRLRSVSDRPGPQPPKLGLMLPMQGVVPLQAYNQATSQLQHRTEDILREVLQGRCGQKLQQRALAAQEASLTRWTKALKDWDASREKLSGKLRRPCHSLVANRPLPLPPIQNHLARSYGPEYDFPRWRQKDRSYHSDAFFLLPEHLGPEDDSLVFSLPWSKRKLYKPPVAMVRPHLGEQTPFQNQRGKTPQLSVTERELTQLSLTGHQVPSEEESQEKEEEEALPELITSREEVWITCDKRGSRLVTCEPCGVRMGSAFYVRKTLPALKLHRFTYVWGQPCLQDVVEIGVVSNAGEAGLTYISLANVGCCVMRFSWRRLPHLDHFLTGRYRNSPFIFNAGNGSLLPEEKLSIPVQFHSRYAGCWTEQWLLRTTPCVYRGMEGSEEIAVSLWGQALEVDVNLAKRQQMDQELEDSAVLRMAQRYAWDLVRLLPIRSLQERAEEAFQQHAPSVRSLMNAAMTDEDPVTAFSRHNPALHFHSAAIGQLQNARYELQFEVNALLERAESRTTSPVTVPTERVSSKISMTGSPSAEKAGRRTPRSRKITQTSSGSISLPRRQKISIRQLKTPSLSTAASYSLQDVELKRLQRQAKVEQVCREAYALSEDSEKKDEIMHNMNQAILLMCVKPFMPPMKHYKHILVRAALAQLFDNLALKEWTLRSHLHLLDDPRFQRLSTFPEDLPKPAELKRRSLSKERAKKNSTGSRKGSKRQSEQQLREEPIDWEEPVPRQYREKLWTLVYGLLASTLESLEPIATFDDCCTNPVLPRPQP